MAGALVLWGMWRDKGMDVRAFVPVADFLERIELSWEWRYLIELALFVILGAILGIALTQPTSQAQAVTAGFGWTGFFTVPRKRQMSAARKAN